VPFRREPKQFLASTAALAVFIPHLSLKALAPPVIGLLLREIVVKYPFLPPLFFNLG